MSVCCFKDLESDRLSKSKLLLITDLYPNKFNPVNGVFVQQQAIELSRFYQVQVVAACDKNPYLIYRAIADGFPVKVICYPYWRKFFASLVTNRLLALPAIKRYKRFQPDIIHIHDYRHIRIILAEAIEQASCP